MDSNNTNQEEKNLKLSQIPPKPLGINKRSIIVASSLLAFVLIIVLVTSVSNPKTEEPQAKASYGTSNPSEIISSLPKDYTNWVSEKPKTFTNKEIYVEESNSSKSDEEKYLESERIRRLKRAVAARESDIFVNGVKLRDLPNERGGNQFAGLKLTEAGNEASNEANENSRDLDNRQDDKYNFLNQKHNSETHLGSTIIKKASEYELMAGSLISGLLLTGLNSDLPGQIVGQVSHNVFDSVSGNYLLIPQGTKVIGAYDSRVSYGQERILIVWTRLIFPNGDSISLEGMPGVDLSGYAGLKDKVNNHYGKLITGVVFGSVLGAGAQMARGSNQTINPSFSQLALEGSAQNLNQAGQQITRKNLNIQPTLEVRPGMRFNVFVTKDITLKPYR